MKDLHAVIGEQYLTIEDRKRQYQQLLGVLAAVVKGELEVSRLFINLTDQTWSFCEQGQRPALPATINGLPVCVVAPEEGRPAMVDAQTEIIKGFEAKVKELMAAKCCPVCNRGIKLLDEVGGEA